jgi:polyhydroxyalkanoate synthesis regulator protein
MTRGKIQMRKFVKYRNRKLHENGSKKSYFSMQELGDVVAAGAEVSIVDDATGEDLTTMTLARILYDRCREGYPVRTEAIQKILIESRSRPKAGKVAA